MRRSTAGTICGSHVTNPHGTPSSLMYVQGFGRTRMNLGFAIERLEVGGNLDSVEGIQEHGPAEFTQGRAHFDLATAVMGSSDPEPVNSLFHQPSIGNSNAPPPCETTVLCAAAKPRSAGSKP